ncbi:putative chemotaxis protein MotB [Clostridiales bacterium oral taxon 876 str. F0540]|nr:putative chemotaxis protein MotB [Clostridiales bacterium oral taxon 876 str. F0540]
MMKKKREVKKVSHERWLLTYSDLITLLMIFFIVMYSFSNLDKQKYKQIAAGLGKAMGGGGYTLIGEDSGTAIDETWMNQDTNIVNMEEESKLEKMKDIIDNYLKESGLSESVVTKVEERGLVLSFKDSLFFDSGKADIKTEQVKKLVEIGRILNQPLINDSYIRVEGHTDNVPINTYLFKSNWDLSVIRASNVAQLLITQSGIKPGRISATGYGEFRPRSSNNTEEGKANNRRVDIIIMNTKFNEVENNSK